MFKGRYARFMFAPDTGVDSGAGVGTNGADGNGENDGAQEKDYAAEFAKLEAKYKSLKESFDKKASQLSAKEKAEREKMSEAEKLQAEREEERQRYIEMQNRVYEMETTTLFAEQGFDKKDYGELVKQIVSVSGEHATELSNSIIAFVKKSNNSAIANAKNGMIKDSAITPKASTTENNTPYAKLATENNNLSNKSNEIKNYYKRK